MALTLSFFFGGDRGGPGRGILASIAVKGPAASAPSRPALPTPTAVAPAAPTPAPERKQEDPKKKLFQHRI